MKHPRFGPVSDSRPRSQRTSSGGVRIFRAISLVASQPRNPAVTPTQSPARENRMPAVCRWGILGTANIARKNWKAIRLAENATLTAVASRDPAKARTFIDECSAEVPFPTTPTPTTYDDLLKRPDVDAVYVPL